MTFLLGFSSHAQEVSISNELNIRNYFSYEILGKIDDRILIYRDKGFTKQIDVFNQDMEHTQFSELVFEKKKIDVFSVVGLDSVFQMIYGYFEKDTMQIKMREYSKGVVMLDSTTLIKIPKDIIRRRISFAVSDDKNKVLLSTMDDKDRFLFYLYDCKLKKIVWQNIFLIPGDSRKNFQDILLTNSGQFFITLEDQSNYEKIISFAAIDPFSNAQFVLNLSFGEKYQRDYYLDFDNKNNELIVCGTYADKKGKESKGIYLMKKEISKLSEMEAPVFIEYNKRLFEDLLQGKKKKNKVLDNLSVQNIIHRNDGGLLVISEITREFSRRNPYNTSSHPRDAYNPYSRRGWVDFYNDDIIIININPQKEIDWSKILYKKQFSQDDDAVFSSFFIMKTPSRLRFIYNDEIKRNNTVSEYLMDPTGKIARNSLLSTVNQEMKLRFQDALQISSNAIIVPSEKNYDLNLVKITY